MSAVAAVAARETKGIDLADIDRADAQGAAAQREPVTRSPDGPESTDLVEGAVKP